MGVVDWVHSYTAGLWALALPAVTTGLTDLDEFVLGVANRAHSCPSIDGNATHFGAWQTKDGIWPVLCHELHARSSGTGDLAAATWLQLNVVHGGTDGDVAQWQGVAWLDLRPLSVLQGLPDLHAFGGKHVALLAIMEVQQENATASVRVVFDRSDLCWDSIFVSLEVDLAILLLVTATAVTAGLATVAVTTTGAGLALEQGTFRRGLGDF